MEREDKRDETAVFGYQFRWQVAGTRKRGEAGERVSAPLAPDSCEPPWSGRGRVGERGSVGEGLSVEEPRREVRSGGLEH